ncbi:MalY/PatB family protein [Virgibacillus sp. SK37]|uniref:MalY/PatB family protein n=1 Tax=Virgibacillus sp. SK37 TaxID=403957 RepID=UPI0004D0D189|nr:PatB family C-S lyase [Virgibacillus sp. SK37]AIF44013.1 cystathionine beta-lyase [Virgibacillus sp. SK37]
MSLFDMIQDRLNTRSVKWDMRKAVFNTDEVLPMWVADMDFKAPQQVLDALANRAEHGVFGYTAVDQDVKDSIVNWLHKRHNWTINDEWLSFSPGVVTSLHMAIQALTNPGDKVIIQTPVYTPFFNVVNSHDRQLVKNPLSYKNNYYTIDFEDLEEKMKQGAKALILCSPHNPVGRVWSREELERIADLCIKHDVICIADEIHGDLTLSGNKHIPFASISEKIADRTITCMAPSKTFNLAGLQASYIVTANKEMREKIDKCFSNQGLGMLNTMGNVALEAAYLHGEQWLDELLEILERNKNYVVEMLNKHKTGLKVVQTEGTYLLWIDCSDLNMNTDELKAFMITEAKVGLNPGASYGVEGNQFMRMNIACPKATLEEGVNRLIKAIQSK